MELKRTNKAIFSQPVSDLLEALSSVGFFEESMLIGSWVMPLYQEFFGMSYALRTMDIDFAVQLLQGERPRRIDLQGLIVSQGFAPFITQSGIQKFSREGFTIEFIAHRRGGRDEDPVFVKNWNITAIPLPFVSIMTDFPFMAECRGYQIKAPIPEAFFLHKLITSARRKGESKKMKDLEQCSVIAPGLDQKRLEEVYRSVRLSSRTWDAVRSSCETIHFPPQNFGLEEKRGGKKEKGG
ncbi:MAG TPA: GSU2403 family nucleotidyltransferase fold protein [Syntrophorhabdaceae bacterium]|nr:GSU2403 family nucleotidyltransferase fold protein [Syntrophorhabdaceae bacterium]HQM80112.1 GSU2403 family nucleotidyltransferase fold protein [Syntrophorhabdaceae bacterium]